MYRVVSQDHGPSEIPARHILGSRVFRNLGIFSNLNREKHPVFTYSEIKNRDPRISYPGILGLPGSWDIISWDPGSSGILGYDILGFWVFRDPGISYPRIRERQRLVSCRVPRCSAGSRSIRPPGVGARMGRGRAGGMGRGAATARQILARRGVGRAGTQTIIPSAWLTWWPPLPPSSSSNSSPPPPLHPVMGTKYVQH